MKISSRGKKEKRSDDNTLFSIAMNNFHEQKRISQVKAHNRAVKVGSLDLRYGVCPVRLPGNKEIPGCPHTHLSFWGLDMTIRNVLSAGE